MRVHVESLVSVAHELDRSKRLGVVEVLKILQRTNHLGHVVVRAGPEGNLDMRR
jgi:hypothetical protein